MTDPYDDLPRDLYADLKVKIEEIGKAKKELQAQEFLVLLGVHYRVYHGSGIKNVDRDSIEAMWKKYVGANKNTKPDQTA